MDGIADIIIRSPNLFKLKLDIGEEAYRTLSTWNNITKYYDAGGAGMTGAAIAGSSVVANTFFAGNGILSLIGIGAAATPVGWLVAAGLASGAAYYGISNILEKQKDGMVKVVPTFINTPLDVLAVGMSNLMFPLAFQVALADGYFSEEERIEIREYFADEWGYSPEYIDKRFSELESDLQEFSIEELTDGFLRYIRENKDCNHKSISKEILSFLHDIAKSDGVFTQEEKDALSTIEETINTQLSPQFGKRFAESLATIQEKTKGATSTIGQTMSNTAARLKDSASNIAKPTLPKPSLGAMKTKSGAAFSSVVVRAKASRDSLSGVFVKKPKGTGQEES